MEIHSVTHDFKKFVDWFNSLDLQNRFYTVKGNCVVLDIEMITDEAAMNGDQLLPFTEEEIEVWQKSGLITVEMIMDCYTFKPSKKITLNYQFIADPL